MKKLLLSLALLLLLLSGCVPPAPTPTPTFLPDPPSATVSATPPAPSPTPSPSPEAIPLPSPSLWSGAAEDFTGEWHRTEVHADRYGLITVYDQTEEGFQFDAYANWFGNSGTLEGEIAQFTGPNRAVWTYISELNPTHMLRLTFLLTDSGLEIKEEKNYWALGPFGHNVDMDGSYTRGNPIYYYNDYVVDAIGSEALSALEQIMDTDSYDELLFTIREGQFYGWTEVDQDGYRGLVFSGFYPGIGYSYKLYVGDDGAVLLARNNGFYSTSGETEPPDFLERS